MKDIDMDDVVRRHQAGEPLKHIAKTIGLSGSGLQHRVKLAGIDLERGRHYKRVSLDSGAITKRYLGGESELAISLDLGISRPTIRRRLLEAGVTIRTPSESQFERVAKLTPAQRIQFASAAHAAVRGTTQTDEHRSKIAATVESLGGHASPIERTLCESLRLREIDVLPQKAIGRYNIDLAIAESRIAVEIFGGNWHATGRHAARFRKRTDYILDQGWLPVIIWTGARYPLMPAVTDYLVSLHERRCLGESFDRKEHVIRGDGHICSVAEYKPDNGTIVLGYKPGNPIRGDDGRFG